jgi:hypothetical protein
VSAYSAGHWAGRIDDSGRQERSIGVPLYAAESEGLKPIQVCKGATMASYDEMSPTDRRNLFEGLARLSGFEEGPKNTLPDGTRYEYDAVLKRTVEIIPSGERCPVTLVDGKLKTRFGKDRSAQGGGWL